MTKYSFAVEWRWSLFSRKEEVEGGGGVETQFALQKCEPETRSKKASFWSFVTFSVTTPLLLSWRSLIKKGHPTRSPFPFPVSISIVNWTNRRKFTEKCANIFSLSASGSEFPFPWMNERVCEWNTWTEYNNNISTGWNGNGRPLRSKSPRKGNNCIIFTISVPHSKWRDPPFLVSN